MVCLTRPDLSSQNSLCTSSRVPSTALPLYLALSIRATLTLAGAAPQPAAKRALAATRKYDA